jgi:hypothetical protein
MTEHITWDPLCPEPEWDAITFEEVLEGRYTIIYDSVVIDGTTYFITKRGDKK